MTGVPELWRMEHAVRRLPALERTVFLAVRLDGLSYAEIAERTGLTAERVERILARALLRVGTQLDSPGRPWWRLW